MRAATTKYAEGGIPYAYKVKGKALVIDEKEVSVFRKMRRLRQNSHLSYCRIAEVLNAEGITTRRGKKWNAGTVFDILKGMVARI